MVKSKNYVLTKNNPPETLEDFFKWLSTDAVYARA
jgi:hypothetical protein